jgi:hypothetical protein
MRVQALKTDSKIIVDKYYKKTRNAEEGKISENWMPPRSFFVESGSY